MKVVALMLAGEVWWVVVAVVDDEDQRYGRNCRGLRSGALR